jgi:hypothetical protein
MQDMENINFNQNKQEDINTIREEATIISNNLINKNRQFLEEITEIVNNNETVRKALHKYGPIDETFTDFTVIPWGHRNLDKHSLDLKDIIVANTQHKPQIDVLNSIENELDARITDIKEAISNFSGTEDEAFDLVQKIHKEKNLEPLNTNDTPILEKLS